MAFQKKTWKDRVVEFAGRRTLTRVAGSVENNLVVDVTRNEGQVSQDGDAFSAANMNDLEQRISDAFNFGLIQTLPAGETTMTFTNDSITDDSLIDIYTDPYCTGLKAVNQVGNTLTLTFEKQSVNMRVCVKVR